ncbi:MAG: FAD-dependent oxidoreductase, partial [Acidobacteriota bacterium]
MKPDVVVVGAGAAGLLAALAAAKGGRRVLVLEAARDAGRKIVVSGGGRCNILPMEDAPGRFVSESPNRLVRRFLDRWPLSEQRTFFEELLGGPLREERESKKLFPPSNRAADVRDALRFAVAGAGAVLRAAAPVRDLTRAGDEFTVRFGGEGGEGGGEEIRTARVILATGGLSVLAGGADAAGFAWAAAMGHLVHPTYPALVPLT